jgi:hypothetical protein
MHIELLGLLQEIEHLRSVGDDKESTDFESVPSVVG